jgi:cyclophilin family peptidyl-prolyl cis-trans isomerase
VPRHQAGQDRIASGQGSARLLVTGHAAIFADRAVGAPGEAAPVGTEAAAPTCKDGPMPNPPAMEIDTETIYRVTLQLDRGAIVMDLDPRLARKTVNNFVALARQGYYDGLTFHRVEPGFVIQGGCPEGSGRGGPGYRFEDEPVVGEYTPGAVAMANAGPNTNGSQFFICLDDLCGGLAKNYNLFGHVAEGMDVVLGVQRGDVMRSVTIEERPAT